ncbi:peptidyl-tRNA hydrolase [Rhodococcoides kyotonense]|uniref:peptidyl-tRNA hydrolase n=1 Tax=Rhodococcoides kyotonense TaxID=398843 RepID=A0A239DIY5_9NOCA|nr:peptidyl-tRNA hydrolase [Rhodococcus kyotonensis]SNS31868.1 Peptidyl-tRNA hydrolase [Rhodococcus kyotonensis]
MTEPEIVDADSRSTFAQRHAVLAQGYGGRADPADPADVLAMPIVLNIPKADPPARSRLLEAAASASVALCFDERVGPDGEWEESFRAWTSSRIRKVARRARGAHWTAAQDVAGVTVDLGDAQARAFVPGRVGDLDPRIKRLQIGGTDLAHDEPDDPAGDLPILWIDPSLEMTVGKAAAQVGHASMLLAGIMTAAQAEAWAARGFACSVRDADAKRWAHARTLVEAGHAVAVRDAGFTEVAPGSMTVIAAIPEYAR